MGRGVLDDVLLEVVDEFEVDGDIFVVIEGEGADQLVEVLHKVAEG